MQKRKQQRTNIPRTGPLPLSPLVWSQHLPGDALYQRTVDPEWAGGWPFVYVLGMFAHSDAWVGLCCYVAHSDAWVGLLCCMCMFAFCVKQGGKVRTPLLFNSSKMGRESQELLARDVCCQPIYNNIISQGPYPSSCTAEITFQSCLKFCTKSVLWSGHPSVRLTLGHDVKGCQPCQCLGHNISREHQQ